MKWNSDSERESERVISIYADEQKGQKYIAFYHRILQTFPTSLFGQLKIFKET